ncbi:hypothetical protein LIER_23527 [Lithospermum erythrorhizon]|uniref:Uncharacterized protein n=1 Tax=Lithospermum erythrorhizon TaxID=34254 RepID=A0AAV3QZ56_LITER
MGNYIVWLVQSMMPWGFPSQNHAVTIASSTFSYSPDSGLTTGWMSRNNQMDCIVDSMLVNDDVHNLTVGKFKDNMRKFIVDLFRWLRLLMETSYSRSLQSS